MKLKHLIIPVFIAWLVSMYHNNVKLSIFIPIITIWLIVVYHLEVKEYKLVEKKIYPNKVLINNEDIIKEVWRVDYTFKGHEEIKYTRYFEDYKIATDYTQIGPHSCPSDLWVFCFITSSMILFFGIPIIFFW